MTEKKINTNSETQKEMAKLEKQVDSFNETVKSLDKDIVSRPRPTEEEPQTRLSSKDLDKTTDYYLKPTNILMSKERFNEKYREAYEFSKQQVRFIAEHRESPGECIELWTKAYPGQPAEFWIIPTNKPVVGPRYVAEQIKGSTYRKLKMSEESTANNSTGSDHMSQYYGKITVSETVQRLDALPVTNSKSIFMGVEGK